MDYKIIAATSMTALERDVGVFMARGWVCQGGVFVVRVDATPDFGTIYYCYQAMVIGRS